MTSPLLGTFDSPLDDEARDLVFQSLRPLRALHFPVGAHGVRLTRTESVTIRVEREHSAMLRIVDRILSKMVREHRTALVALARRSSMDSLLLTAWRLLRVVRETGYRHGVYSVPLEDGRVVELSVGRWDAALIEQLDEFVYETYRAAWWIFDAVLSDGGASVEPRLLPTGPIGRAA